jgi:hypothetical protein
MNHRCFFSYWRIETFEGFAFSMQVNDSGYNRFEYVILAARLGANWNGCGMLARRSTIAPESLSPIWFKIIETLPFVASFDEIMVVSIVK